MLQQREMFNKVENILYKDGIIPEFENKSGRITGRMMIIQTNIPENVILDACASDARVCGFEASFDFYNMIIGIAIDTKNKKIVSGLWTRKQSEEASMVDDSWIAFFVDTLLDNICDDGSFGYPMYSFVNDTDAFTIVPTKP